MCDPVSGWKALDPEIFSVEFGTVIANFTEQDVQRLQAFLGPDFSARFDPSLLDQSNWDIVSKPVFKGLGKSSSESLKRVTPVEEKLLKSVVESHYEWNRGALIECPSPQPQDFLPNIICKPEAPQLQKKPKTPCQIVGNTFGSARGDGVRTHLCIPKSCPADLFSGLIVTSYKGNIKHSQKGLGSSQFGEFT